MFFYCSSRRHQETPAPPQQLTLRESGGTSFSASARTSSTRRSGSTTVGQQSRLSPVQTGSSGTQLKPSFPPTEDFLQDDADSEDFGDWAERIRREYVTQQRARAQRLASDAAPTGRKRRKTKEEAEEEERARRELQERLQREHAEYLARARRKEAETRLSRKKRYEERCAAAFGSGGGDGGPSSARLRYADIPWPAPRGSVPEMVEVMLHGADRADPPAFRKLLRRQQALWHPDKFAQRCGDRLEEAERKRILDTVTALSQELNRLAQSVR